MSDYDNRNHSSDLDAYKWLDDTLATSISVSGTLAAASSVGEEYYDSGTLTLPYSGGDFRVWVYDNSYYHSGEFRKGQLTFIEETTIGSPLAAPILAIVDGDTIKFRLRLLNPYGFTVNLVTTTINIKVLVYDATVI